MNKIFIYYFLRLHAFFETRQNVKFNNKIIGASNLTNKSFPVFHDGMGFVGKILKNRNLKIVGGIPIGFKNSISCFSSGVRTTNYLNSQVSLKILEIPNVCH